MSSLRLQGAKKTLLERLQEPAAVARLRFQGEWPSDAAAWRESGDSAPKAGSMDTPVEISQWLERARKVASFTLLIHLSFLPRCVT